MSLLLSGGNIVVVHVIHLSAACSLHHQVAEGHGVLLIVVLVLLLLLIVLLLCHELRGVGAMVTLVNWGPQYASVVNLVYSHSYPQCVSGKCFLRHDSYVTKWFPSRSPIPNPRLEVIRN